jgi:hypothetical protein
MIMEVGMFDEVRQSGMPANFLEKTELRRRLTDLLQGPGISSCRLERPSQEPHHGCEV